eukprot:scaffold112441_cov21-Tisochrysis_lutea.AAC.1
MIQPHLLHVLWHGAGHAKIHNNCRQHDIRCKGYVCYKGVGLQPKALADRLLVKLSQPASKSHIMDMGIVSEQELDPVQGQQHKGGQRESKQQQVQQSGSGVCLVELGAGKVSTELRP